MPPKKKPAKKPKLPAVKKPKKAKLPAVKKPQKQKVKNGNPAIAVHYPPGKEHLYPKSHPKYKPKKK